MELTIKELTKANTDRCIEFGHDLNSWNVLEWAGATAGEIGEACNVSKKINRLQNGWKGNRPGEDLESLKEKLAQEISDGIIYSVLWATSIGIDLTESLRKTFNSKSEEIGSSVRI